MSESEMIEKQKNWSLVNEMANMFVDFINAILLNRSTKSRRSLVVTPSVAIMYLNHIVRDTDAVQNRVLFGVRSALPEAPFCLFESSTMT